MRISVIGCGYLGAVHAASMAELGHTVVGIDVDAAKIAALSAGQAPFFEPGLPELLARGIEAGRLRFSTDVADAGEAEAHFIAVGTPQRRGEHGADHGVGAVGKAHHDAQRVAVGKVRTQRGQARRKQRVRTAQKRELDQPARDLRRPDAVENAARKRVTPS